MSQKDRKTENEPTEEQKDRKTDRTTEKQEDRSSIFLFGPVGEVLVTVRSPTHGAQQSYLRMHSPPRGWLALSTKLENKKIKMKALIFRVVHTHSHTLGLQPFKKVGHR